MVQNRHLVLAIRGRWTAASSVSQSPKTTWGENVPVTVSMILLHGDLIPWPVNQIGKGENQQEATFPTIQFLWCTVNRGPIRLSEQRFDSFARYFSRNSHIWIIRMSCPWGLKNLWSPFISNLYRVIHPGVELWSLFEVSFLWFQLVFCSFYAKVSLLGVKSRMILLRYRW